MRKASVTTSVPVAETITSSFSRASGFEGISPNTGIDVFFSTSILPRTLTLKNDIKNMTAAGIAKPNAKAIKAKIIKLGPILMRAALSTTLALATVAARLMAFSSRLLSR